MVVVVIDPVMQIPSVFSPNGDGINDGFRIQAQDLATFNFKIYNRWGEQVFATNSLDIVWDGMYKGKPLDMDTYMYVAIGITLDNKKIIQQGSIVIIK